MRVLGFMTGTSLDACDMAILETDGHAIQGFGPAGERKLSEPVRDLILETTQVALGWARGTPEPDIFAKTSQAVAREHFEAAAEFLANQQFSWRDIDLIGMHGQTVLHERPTSARVGRTVQLGDGQWLADQTGVPVVYDFRTMDVAAGGEGAPLAPIYHLARAQASRLTAPLAMVNIGGVANVTFWSGDEAIAAFDTGPGNGMIDLLVQTRSTDRFDDGGQLALAGKVDDAVLAGLLAHPYFAAPPPKSLDRYDFPVSALDGLTLTDAAATLVAFTAEAMKLGFSMMGGQPTELIVCGGGRHNPAIMQALRARIPVPVSVAEDHGWRGDSIEAEAFAFLAARRWVDLPISYPATTGVRSPMIGGTIAMPPG